MSTEDQGISLGEINRRLTSIERKLDDRTYVSSEVFQEYQKLILETNRTQSERITKLETWQTSVYALLGASYLGIIGTAIVSFVK